MKRARSIALRLSLVFLFLLLLVILLGSFGTGSLSYFNAVSSQIRDRWLPSTRVLGDLNNLTSDHRVAEASILLASDPRELIASARQLDDLDRSIEQSERIYARIPRDSEQEVLHARFRAQWSQYERLAQQVRSLAGAGDQAAARALYNGASKTAYDIASHTFDRLNESNVESARQASFHSAAAYLRARWVISMTIVLAGMAVACAMIYMRRSISDPLLDLATRMHRLAANERGVQIDGVGRHDEIGEMARAVVVFRNNAIELASSRLALEKQASMLQEKLAEEQRLMRLQRNFVSMASHEFRTPLTIIDAHAQRLIAMKDRLEPGSLAERARKIRTAVLRMTHLIHNLIDSARVIDGEVELYFHPAVADLRRLLHEVCLLQREIAPHARILESLGEGSLHIVGDANLLHQVFSNLLSNAVKYSPGAAVIKVSARCEENGSVNVAVEDEGIGIPEIDCARIFERYYRGSNAGGITGTGVGLYFVRMVVELHGGEVHAESRYGGGARFTVRLPISSGRQRERVRSCADVTSGADSLPPELAPPPSDPPASHWRTGGRLCATVPASTTPDLR
jgi:two-component system, OmpR family, sensor kinase